VERDVVEVLALTAGVAAAIAFPVLVLSIQRRRARRHDRRMAYRRTDKIRL
jgi:Na+(H+)/acetate symporter ActP